MLPLEQRAAQYVRMSTDMQRYSIENQMEAIALFAARRGLTIVRSYEDAGRSGLLIAGRDALKRLIHDVQTGSADFTRVLVYDVSRWGRFQDCDESAYYEFICKQAGVQVEYCAEQFENDGSLTATIIKNIKRAMAGEYSRELSTKVFIGKCRIISNGFRVGSVAGYGLRRCLVDEYGNRKQILEGGQHKSIHTDRVVLVPGPSTEVKTVERVYGLFLDDRATLREIARALNSDGILSDRGRAWTAPTIRGLLSNEKYIGNNVFNQTTQRLSTRKKFNPRLSWVRKSYAFEPIITRDQFEKAQRLLSHHNVPFTDAEMMNYLTAIWCSKGAISRTLIDAVKGAPSGVTYGHRYGSLVAACRKIGYVDKSRSGSNRFLREHIIGEIESEIARRGGTVRRLPRRSHVRINEQMTLMVCIARTRPARPTSQWVFGHASRRKDDIIIIIRIHDGTNEVKDFLVLPTMYVVDSQLPRLSGRTYERLGNFTVPNLTEFYDLCGRKSLEHGNAKQAIVGED